MTPTDPLAESIAAIVLARLREKHVEQRVFTTRQAAAYLGMSGSQIQRLASSGRLRAIRVDSSLRFDRKDLDLLIDSHKEV
jgi:excisionase family DNA binding protein